MTSKWDSPLEDKFIAALPASLRKIAIRQYEVGKFKADVAFISSKLVVEIDGQVGHSSEDQLEHDARRDRFFASQGYLTLRFRGREVYHDVGKVIKEVERFHDMRKPTTPAKSAFSWFFSPKRAN